MSESDDPVNMYYEQLARMYSGQGGAGKNGTIDTLSEMEEYRRASLSLYLE
jgi:hypothetical protein